jgi:hypothetical protein
LLGAVSVLFNPAAGVAMVDAAIKDVIVKVGRKAELLKSNAIGTSANRVAQPKRRGRGLRKPGAAAVVVGDGLAMGVRAGVNGEVATASAPGNALQGTQTQRQLDAV